MWWRKGNHKMAARFDIILKKALKARCSDKPFVRDYEYYFKELEDNLVCEMNDLTRMAYIKGSGSELQPPKMHAVYSSSAMTFNLFGNVNDNVQVKSDSKLPPGNYKLEYEKKLPAVQSPANLDACLTSDDNILLFEMKMTEWILGQPKNLSGTYLRNKNIYPDPTFCDAMQELMRKYIPEGKRISRKNEYRCRTTHFDVFQIMLHIFAIYKALHVNTFPDEYKNIRADYKLPAKPKHITLVIGYWTVPKENFFTNNEDYDIYKINIEGSDETPKEHTMRYEINEFTETLEKTTIKDLFLDKYKVTFDVKALTVKEIVACLDKKVNDLNALIKRYL